MYMRLTQREKEMADMFEQMSKDEQEIMIEFAKRLRTEDPKELVKEIKKMGEESKVAIRQVRRDGLDEFKKMQKDSVITEDDLKQAEEQIQKLTDKYVEQIDKVTEAKEKEIMTV